MKDQQLQFAIKLSIHRGNDIVTVQRFNSSSKAQYFAKWNYKRSLDSEGNLPRNISIIRV